MTCDCLLMVPFEPPTGSIADPRTRTTLGARLFLPVVEALCGLESHLGRRIQFYRDTDRPLFGGSPFAYPEHRSLTAMTLATHLERTGLSWRAIDPGTQEIGWWRHELARFRDLHPKTVAVSTTFVMSFPWAQTLLATIRRAFPRAKVIVGGYYYATDVKAFLSLDADVYVTGEGEIRLPAVVEAIRDGRPLDDIPGVYLPGPDGLKSTGRVEQLGLSTLPGIDWSLAERIEPPIGLQRGGMEMGVETQRGCVFKCEFCTYRTLSSSDLLEVEAAADRILATRVARGGSINMTDATATFPRHRWEALLDALIRRGGSPHPIWAFARVSDIDEEIARKMAAANVRHLFIGQESGDQEMLNRMKKGTRVSHVRPAVAALDRHGIVATFGMIHGFPGETAASIEATRRLLATINEGFDGRPTVLMYGLGPFFLLDFAAVNQAAGVRQGEHYLDYDAGEFTAEQIARECLRTVVEVSKVPHAPVWGFVLVKSPQISGIEIAIHPRRNEIHRWLKALERGVALYVERNVFGARIDRAELDRVSRILLDHYPKRGALRRGGTRIAAMGEERMMSRLRREWTAESEAGPGLVTRAMLARASLRDTGRVGHAAATFSRGSFPIEAGRRPDSVVAEHASGIIGAAIARGRKAKLGEGARVGSGGA